MTEKLTNHVVKAPSIIGSTTINHAARIELGLNCSEYVLMNYVFHCAKNSIELEITETYRKTGFTEELQLQVMNGLIMKGFVMINPNPIPQITTKWESAFTDIESEFDNLFWKKNGKVIWLGSPRKSALVFYIKLRKKYPKEIIIKAKDDYLEYLELVRKTGFNRAIMGADKWLNEKNEFYLVDWKESSADVQKELDKKKPATQYAEPITSQSRKAGYDE